MQSCQRKEKNKHTKERTFFLHFVLSLTVYCFFQTSARALKLCLSQCIAFFRLACVCAIITVYSHTNVLSLIDMNQTITRSSCTNNTSIFHCGTAHIPIITSNNSFISSLSSCKEEKESKMRKKQPISIMVSTQKRKIGYGLNVFVRTYVKRLRLQNKRQDMRSKVRTCT